MHKRVVKVCCALFLFTALCFYCSCAADDHSNSSGALGGGYMGDSCYRAEICHRLRSDSLAYCRVAYWRPGRVVTHASIRSVRPCCAAVSYRGDRFRGIVDSPVVYQVGRQNRPVSELCLSRADVSCQVPRMRACSSARSRTTEPNSSVASHLVCIVFHRAGAACLDNTDCALACREHHHDLREGSSGRSMGVACRRDDDYGIRLHQCDMPV